MSLKKILSVLMLSFVIISLAFVQFSCTMINPENNEEKDKEESGENDGKGDAGEDESSDGTEDENKPGISGDNSGENTEKPEDNENEKEDPELPDPVYHSVTVVGNGDAPLKNLMVKIFDPNGNRVGMNFTDANGKAVFDKIPIGNYTFEISSTDNKISYYYDAELCVLTPDSVGATVKVYSKLTTKNEMVYGPGIESENGAKAFSALAGTYAIRLSVGMNYVVFQPETSGIFAVTAESEKSVNCANYGIPFYVQENSVTDADKLLDNGFNVEVSPLQGDNSVYTPYVIGIYAEEVCDAILSIVRVGNISDNPIYKPWTDITAKHPLSPYSVEAGKSFTYLDITDPTLNVVLGSDGYYHVGDANGPIVVVKITEASEYIDSFVAICETSTMGWYDFEDGEFVKKERFNDLILAYAEICDKKFGVCPLTEELAYAIKMNGEYHNWWNFAKPENIFHEDAPFIVKENAWLFACGIIR